MHRRLVGKLRQWHERARHFVVHDLLHADDPPHRLALGVALGMFFAFIPVFGVQMVFVVIFAWLLNANKVVGAPLVWITNPATIVPIYYFCYILGIRLLGQSSIGGDEWAELAAPPADWAAATSLYSGRMHDVIIPVLLGSFIVGLVAAILVYLFTYQFIRSYRLRRWGQLVPPQHNINVDIESIE